jgi:hypothetical protein
MLQGRLAARAALMTSSAALSRRSERWTLIANHLRSFSAAALAAAAVGAGMAAWIPINAKAQQRHTASTVLDDSGGDFANPPMADRPMYRFWNTGGLMTPASISEQVAQMKVAGAGGFEANQLAGIPGLRACSQSPGSAILERCARSRIRVT